VSGLFCTACSLAVHETQDANVDSEATDSASEGEMDTVDGARSDVLLPVDDNRRGHIENVQEVDVKDEVLDEKTSDVLSESIPDGSSGNGVTCSICGKHLKTLATLKRHMSLHDSHGPNTCPICQQKCLLYGHVCPVGVARVLGRRILQSCSVCGVRVSSDLMERHMLTHGRQHLKCPICDHDFRHQSLVDKHMRTHDRYNALLHVVFLLIASSSS